MRVQQTILLLFGSHESLTAQKITDLTAIPLATVYLNLRKMEVQNTVKKIVATRPHLTYTWELDTPPVPVAVPSMFKRAKK